MEDGDSIGLNMDNGMWVHLRFAKFLVSWIDPETKQLRETFGYGASEFGYRIEGVKPYRPTTAAMAPVLVVGSSSLLFVLRERERLFCCMIVRWE